MTFPIKVEDKKCPKCGLEEVFRQEFLLPPTEEDLEEGKIVAGLFAGVFNCRSCGWSDFEPKKKLYSDDIYT